MTNSEKPPYQTVANQNSSPSIQADATQGITDFKKRCVALLVDVAVGYLLGIVLGIVGLLIPFLHEFLSVTVVIILYFLVRDYLFDGRGVGKNMMGLQVVDIKSKKPASLVQSIRRNLILLAPFIILMLVNAIAPFIPIVWLNQLISTIVHGLGTIYCAVIFPLEAYRVYKGKGSGSRLGDDLAGTTVIESDMDFSQIVR